VLSARLSPLLTAMPRHRPGRPRLRWPACRRRGSPARRV